MYQTIHPLTGSALWVLSAEDNYSELFKNFLKKFGKKDYDFCFLDERGSVVSMGEYPYELLDLVKNFCAAHGAEPTYIGTNPLTESYMVGFKQKI